MGNKDRRGEKQKRDGGVGAKSVGKEGGGKSQKSGGSPKGGKSDKR